MGRSTTQRIVGPRKSVRCRRPASARALRRCNTVVEDQQLTVGQLVGAMRPLSLGVAARCREARRAVVARPQEAVPPQVKRPRL